MIPQFEGKDFYVGVEIRETMTGRNVVFIKCVESAVAF